MATQTVRFTGRTGLTLTADVYDDTTAASFATGVTITESVGIYSFTLTDSAGTYRVCVKRSGTVIDTLFVKTANAAAIYDCVIEKASLNHASQSVLDEMYANVMGSFPTNFESLGITVGGHISRVTLVDLTTENTDMRGTDGANTATPLDAAATRAAVGMATANLDTQLAGKALETTAQSILAKANVLPASFPTNFAALGINSDGHVSRVTLVDTTTTNTDMRGTDGALTELPSIPAGWITGTGLDSTAIVAMGSYQIPQTVPAVGTAPTRDQALGMLVARGTKSAIVGTTETIYAADGTTPLYTLTLTNSGEYTTAIARAS